MSEMNPRYQRNISVENFGEDGQRKLLEAKVLVVGAGGLGSAVLQYLVATGVGTIGIMEFDTVDITNLQRQVLYTSADIGRAKIDVAAEQLSAQNPEVIIEKYPYKATDENARLIFEKYQIVVDCTDNYAARQVISRHSAAANIPMIYGTAQGSSGQISVFNYGGAGSYTDLYPETDTYDDTTTVGVLSPMPGIVGTLQAMEVIKIITGYGEPLCGRLLVIDSANCNFNIFNLF